MEKTIIGPLYMLDQWLMPQLQADSQDFIYQQDGSLLNDVREYLDATFHVIGLDVLLGMTLLPWPVRSSDLTLCDFFLWT